MTGSGCAFAHLPGPSFVELSATVQSGACSVKVGQTCVQMIAYIRLTKIEEFFEE